MWETDHTTAEMGHQPTQVNIITTAEDVLYRFSNVPFGVDDLIPSRTLFTAKPLNRWVVNNITLEPRDCNMKTPINTFISAHWRLSHFQHK